MEFPSRSSAAKSSDFSVRTAPANPPPCGSSAGISTHILEEVEAVCNRAIIIARGRLLADATPAVLLAGAPDAGSVAVTLATGDPQRAIEVISREPGVVKVAVAERVNGVTRLLVH